jgi:hypothetical protein
VNENTEGYYYKNMNILVKKNIRKLYELSSVPFDILPTTRYIMFRLYYFNDGDLRLNQNGYGIIYMKNSYLSFFEKTYAAKSSLLGIRFLLKLNYPINFCFIRKLYINSITEPMEKVIDFFLMDQKITF